MSIASSFRWHLARPLIVLLAIAGGSACSPAPAPPADDSSGSGETSGSSTTATPGEGTTAGGDTTSDPGSSGGDATQGPETNFIDAPDGGENHFLCDLFEQDCPRGDKCMPVAVDGGNDYNGTQCVPIAEDPGAPGDACTYEGDPFSGLDDCGAGAMCWNLDVKTLEGTCYAMCTGEPEIPTCEDPTTTCDITAAGIPLLCIPLCDPIAQDCVPGQTCIPDNDGWQCVPDASGDEGQYGDPCEFVNACDPGLVCIGAAATPGCAGSGCCTEICALGDPQCTGAAQGQTCQPWYEEGTAPAGYEDVGVCALP